MSRCPDTLGRDKITYVLRKDKMRYNLSKIRIGNVCCTKLRRDSWCNVPQPHAGHYELPVIPSWCVVARAAHAPKYKIMAIRKKHLVHSDSYGYYLYLCRRHR